MISKRKKSRSVIPVASMGDIAFLLLIFFMISGIAEAEKEIPINLPEARATVEENSKFFNIYISENEANEITYHYGFNRCSFEEMSLLTNYARTKLLNQKPELIPEFRAFIRAEKDIPYKYINGALESLKEAGIYNILFISNKKKAIK